MIEELEDVILTCDLPEHGLTKGDIGTVVLVHNEGKGYEVEFTTLDGEPLRLLPCWPIRFVRANPGKSPTPAI